jgi:hypothetical protein
MAFLCEYDGLAPYAPAAHSSSQPQQLQLQPQLTPVVTSAAAAAAPSPTHSQPSSLRAQSREFSICSFNISGSIEIRTKFLNGIQIQIKILRGLNKVHFQIQFRFKLKVRHC